MAAASCHQHPNSPAVGVCMRCERSVCVECVTKLDGINHCQACLAELTRVAPESRRRARLPDWLSLCLSFVALWLLAWKTLGALFPGGAPP